LAVDEWKLGRRNTMKRDVIVIYGSGASFDSGFRIQIPRLDAEINPPTDLNFLSDLPPSLIEDNYQALYKFITQYFPGGARLRLEDVWTAISLNHKHITLGTYHWAKEQDVYLMRENCYPSMGMVSPVSYFPFSGGGVDTTPSFNRYKFLGDCERNLRELIYDVYSSYISPSGSNNFQLLHSAIGKSQGSQLVGYVTFNYDCFLEETLTPNFRYVSANDNAEDIGQLLHEHIPIIKLHGSLNWEENSNPRDVIFRSPPYQKGHQVKPGYMNNMEWSQPAVIPPTIFKQEINDDSRSNDILTKTILQQWRAAIRLLTESDKIIFIGYSFPAADYHAQRIFHIARMRRAEERKPVTKILYCGGREDKTLVLSGIFGKDAKITVKNRFSDLCGSEELSEFLNT
jgi:hypothetical protein